MAPVANGYHCQTQPANVTQSDYERTVCAHAKYFSALVEREGARVHGAGFPDGGRAQRHALLLMATELENVYEALDSALQRRGEAWLLRIAGKLAQFLKIKGDARALHEVYSRLLDAARRLGGSQLELQASLGVGQAQFRLGNYAEAREMLNEARRLALELGDRFGEALSLGNLANVHHIQGDYPPALELQAQALAISRELGDRHGEATALANLAIVHYWQGDYLPALELQTQALTIRRELGDCRGEAISLCNLAGVHSSQGDYSLALELQAQAHVTFRELGDRHGEAFSLGTLAIVHYSQGDYPLSLELQTQALAIRRELGDRSGEAMSLGNLAIVHRLQGDYPLALELQTQSLRIFRELGDRNGEAYSLGNLANVHSHQGDFSLALELNAQALGIRRELGDHPGEVYSCIYSAATLAAVRQHRPAAVLLQGARAAASALGLQFDPEDQQFLTSASTDLDAAVASGEISADDLARWKAEGEALTLDELVQFTQTALRESRGLAEFAR